MPANYVLLERIELNASAASVTFSNIPQTGYTDLKVVASSRGSSSGPAEANRIHFNGDTTNTNYTGKRLLGSGSAASSDQTTAITPGFFNDLAGATANTFANSEVYIPNYTGSNSKSYSIDTVTENNGTEAYAGLVAVRWSGTAAITSMTFTPESSGNFVSGSTFSLYGLAAVGTTPAIAPKASGGNITTDGTYWIHTFLASGTFTPQIALTCDTLVVAGGGGGGSATGDNTNAYGGGGAGAGGFRTATSFAISGSFTVTVGAGGAGGSGSDGSSGSNSVFSSITSTGGGFGAGGTLAARNGGAGGSGGASTAGGTGGSATSGQGSAGASSSAAYGSSGGGGGAGAAGSNVTTDTGGAGGNGLSNSYSGSSVTYAGGGGGGGYNNGLGSSGGTGGGGTGGAGSLNFTTVVAGGNGTANTGGGGGGTGAGGDGGKTGGNGGSGIVIIRYLA